MRRLMFITLMAALWAWGAAAEAALYRFNNGVDFVVSSPSCHDVSKWFVDHRNALASSGIYWWTGDCNLVAKEVGQNTSFTYCYQEGAAIACGGHAAQLQEVIEDDESMDVAGLPVQRVLVLLGGALMLGLGVGVGRIR